MKTRTKNHQYQISNIIKLRSLARPLTDRQTDTAKLKSTTEQFLIVDARVTNVMLLGQHVAFSRMVSLRAIFQWIEKKRLKISPLCIYLFSVTMQM